MNASCWVYMQSEGHLWTVGFFDPGGRWHTDSDHDNRDAARRRVAWLNGEQADGELVSLVRDNAVLARAKQAEQERLLQFFDWLENNISPAAWSTLREKAESDISEWETEPQLDELVSVLQHFSTDGAETHEGREPQELEHERFLVALMNGELKHGDYCRFDGFTAAWNDGGNRYGLDVLYDDDNEEKTVWSDNAF